MTVAKISQASSPISPIGMLDGFDSSDEFYIDLIPRVFIFADIGEEDFEQKSLLLGIDAPILLSDEIGVSDVLLHFYLRDIQIFSEVDIDVSQNFTEQLLTEKVSVVDSSDAVTRVDNLEHELTVATTSPTFFKEFYYSGSEILGYSIYTDESKSEAIYIVSFAFSSGALSTKTIQRVSDNKTLTIQFNYSGDTLISQTRSIS